MNKPFQHSNHTQQWAETVVSKKWGHDRMSKLPETGHSADHTEDPPESYIISCNVNTERLSV